MNELHLFAGIGGGILAGLMLEHRPVCAVEIDPFCRSVLVQRQNDGNLPPFPVWDDIRTFDATRWRGVVDVVCGGFPCQNISGASRKWSEGIFGPKSSLWFEMLRVIREVRPEYVFVENSPMLTARGLDVVLGGLAESGYDAEWMVLGADDVSRYAPHIRKRIWILGKNTEAEKIYPDTTRRRSDAIEVQERKRFEVKIPGWNWDSHLLDACPIWKSGHTGMDCLDDGIPYIVEQFRGIGNAQVPLCAATAFTVLYNRINNRGTASTIFS